MLASLSEFRNSLACGLGCSLTLLLSACGPVEPGVDGKQQPGRAAVLAAACSGCHSASGTAIRDLHPMGEEAIAISFLAYRNDQEGTTVMHRIARGYSEEDIWLIAQHIADQD